MNKTLKRALAVAAAAKLVDKVQEMRQPKRSPVVRAAPVALVLAAVGGIAYLGATGRLGPIVNGIRSLVSGPDSAPGFDDDRPNEIRLPDAPTASSAASPTTAINPS